MQNIAGPGRSARFIRRPGPSRVYDLISSEVQQVTGLIEIREVRVELLVDYPLLRPCTVNYFHGQQLV
jgi:hypothetical protein